MTFLANPPSAIAAPAWNILRGLIAVAHLVPLRCNIGMVACEVVISDDDAVVGAHRATVAVAARDDLGIPHMPALAMPPNSLGGIEAYVLRGQLAVSLAIPFCNELRMRTRQIVEATKEFAVGAVRAAVIDPRVARCDIFFPDMPAFPLPPDLLLGPNGNIFKAQALVECRMPLRGDVWALMGEVIDFRNHETLASMAALGALARGFQRVSHGFLPLEPARRAKPPDLLMRTVGYAVRRKLAVLRRMPHAEQRCIQAFRGVEPGQLLAPVAVNAATLAKDARAHALLPGMTALLAFPPDYPVACASDVAWAQLCILLAVPFGQDVLMVEPLAPLQKRASQSDVAQVVRPFHARLPAAWPRLDIFRPPNLRIFRLSIGDQPLERFEDVCTPVFPKPGARRLTPDMRQAAGPQVNLVTACNR